MIVSIDSIDNLGSLFNFHKVEHATLAHALLTALADKLDFKMKLQKATIHFMHRDSFGVIGFRRTQKGIFVEFYEKNQIISDRIIKRLIGKKNNQSIARVIINDINDIDSELICWIIESFKLSSTEAKTSYNKA